MSAAGRYVETVGSHVKVMAEAQEGVVIFGASRAGWYLMKVLEYLGVKIAGFCDNNAEQLGGAFSRYPVHTVARLAREWPGAYVLIGAFRPETGDAIQRQLASLGVQRAHWNMDAFLFFFFTEVVKRRCDHERLAQSIGYLFENYQLEANHYGYTPGGSFVSPFVTGVITQKCTLRCRDCVQLIPYYDKPVHLPVESVVEDLCRYAEAFDVVPEISLHGGEPFLYPELERLCEEVARISNIVFISFVTNGTLCPSDDRLLRLAACGADVHVSGGYGGLSQKKEELLAALNRQGIYADVHFCLETEKWVQPTPRKKHLRTEAERGRIYGRCVSSKVCCQIMSGELHRCAWSMHASHQGLIPRVPEDFVNLRDQTESEGSLSSEIRTFLTRTKALKACDYCDPEGGTPVPPAIQLPQGQPKRDCRGR